MKFLIDECLHTSLVAVAQEHGLDRKKGVAQSDVYQMMAYARLYDCNRLMLLYPASSGSKSSIDHRFGIHRGTELLALGQIDITGNTRAVQDTLAEMVIALCTQHPNCEALLG